LANIADVPETFASDWADETVDRIRSTKPASTRPASSKFSTKVGRFRAGVYGAFWWLFVDRGTKAHDILPRKKTALKFTVKGETIFAKRAHVGRIRRRPFISRAAQGALHDLGRDAIVKAWNGRRRTGKGSHSRFL